LLDRATIILLNGISSVGKSSICKALQSITTDPFLYMEMDAYLAAMPSKYQDHPNGLSFERGEADGRPTIKVKTGQVADNALSGMRHAAAAVAGQGNNLIIDEVFFGDRHNGFCNPVVEYRRLLAPYTLKMVGVFAPLDVIEAREAARGDRMIGMACWQFDEVHYGMRYDLEVDSGVASAEECAEQIKAAFSL
jgi:chloramphenicol 3-O phosphotransferase